VLTPFTNVERPDRVTDDRAVALIESGRAVHRNYAALSDHFVKADPEAGLIAVVRRMQAVDGHFEYDVSTYVSRPRDVRAPTPYLAWADWWDFGYGGLGLGPGYYYSWFWR